MSQYTNEHFDEDHQDAHREESVLPLKEWVSELEMALGHGDYRMDYALDAFNAGYTPEDYAKKITSSLVFWGGEM